MQLKLRPAKCAREFPLATELEILLLLVKVMKFVYLDNVGIANFFLKKFQISKIIPLGIDR